MKKILYNQCLIPSVMDGTKTKTRRLIKPQPTGDYCGVCTSSTYSKDVGCHGWADGTRITNNIRPRYQLGEVVYVGEAWCLTQPYDPETYHFGYKFGFPGYSDEPASEKYDFANADEWKSPRYMPEEAARTFLKITDVRAERIRDISQADCIAEGIMRGDGLSVWISPHNTAEIYQTAQEAFFALLRYVNKGKPVDLNQWVWVYTFELTEKPTKP